MKSVALGKKALKAGTDYDVAYSGNVNAGTAKAKATGKGAYAGSKSVAFKIKPAANKLVVKAAAKMVKAGTRPGTYKLMVKVTAAKTKNTKAAGGETGYWHYIEGYGKEYVWECNFCEN